MPEFQLHIKLIETVKNFLEQFVPEIIEFKLLDL